MTRPQDYEGLSVTPKGIDPKNTPAYLLKAARSAWDRALELGARYGYRNAQATCIAPTGTIGLVMECDTTGIEPVFSQVALKHLAGGGSMVIASKSVEPALRSLGYADKEREAILDHLERRKTLRGAPHLNDEHLPVFACASEIPPVAHLEMMAAAQPFVSGAISKTVNMPSETTEEEIGHAYMTAWKLGLKAVAVYRDGSKAAQVLEAMRHSEYEPPPCPTCSDGMCQIPDQAPEKEKGPFDGIPSSVRKLRFVAYGADKVPLDPKTGRAASVTSPATWASFQETLSFVEKTPGALGPGLVLRPADLVFCIDLDDIVIPGVEVKQCAQELIERFGTYTESSLSGRGAHLLFRVRELPKLRATRWRWKSPYGAQSIEVYSQSRYIALTGKLWRYDGAGDDLEERTGELERLLSECTPVYGEAGARRGAPGRANTARMLELFSGLGIDVDPDKHRDQKFPCAFHDDDHPSLSIHPDRGWRCFGCERGGGWLALRDAIRDLSDDEAEAVARRTGTKLTQVLALRERLRRNDS